jgi:type II secretory pathway pseudopilin PulG
MKGNLRVQRKHRQRGFTLMEIIVGAIIFIFLLGAIGKLVLANRDAVTGGTDTAVVQNARAKLQQCASNYGADYSWVTTQQAIRCGAIPAQAARGAAAVNSFNGALTFAPGATNATFVITSAGIPNQAQCMSEAAIMWGTWVTVQVNGTSIPQNSQGSAVAAASTACVSGANTLTFESS